MVVFLFVQAYSQDKKIEKNTDPVIQPPSEDIVNTPALSESSVFEGDKIVFWVHGLGGDEYSWDVAAAPTADTYKITSLQNGIDYSSYSLSNAGQVLQTVIDQQAEVQGEINGIEDPTINFLIAHSQGGLVSRAAFKRYVDLDVFDERSFGGIVTFGTPHQGAQIINNIEDVIAYSNSGCNALGAGPATEAWNASWFLGFISTDVLGDAINSVCNTLSNQVLPIVMQDYLQPITEDYQVGAEYLNTLNEFDENMVNDPDVSVQKVAFYGVEEAPIVWRTVYSLMNDVNAEGAFAAGYDAGLIDIANSNQNSYYLKYMAYHTLHDLMTANCIDIVGASALLNPFQCLPVNLSDNYNEYGNVINSDINWWTFNVGVCGENRDAYYLGWRWWAEAEETYLSLIGAVEYVVSSCHCDCLEKYGSDPTPYEVIHQIDCEVTDCSEFENNEDPNVNVNGCDYAIVYDKYIKPNDGVVLQESAQNYPNGGNGSANALAGSNHIQMRNDLNTFIAISLLMDGSNGLYFTTEER